MHASFPFGLEVGMWDLLLIIPDHCLSFYFRYRLKYCISQSFNPKQSTNQLHDGNLGLRLNDGTLLQKDGWIDDLRFYVNFNSISVM